MKTIYPEGYVQKKCFVCGYKSFPIKIPVKLPEKEMIISTKQQINDIFNAEWWKL
jgi:hypothetical protein